MANSGAAQNKLGELFVDIGVGGLGKTLKALNSVSASFLLTKNAAVQMAKPVIDVGKRTLGMAVDVGKLGSTLGLAYKDAYKLQYYFKHMNLNDGLVNDLQKVSEQFSLIAQGQSQLSGEQMTGFANLGMEWQKYYGGGFDKAQQFIKDLQKSTANMDRTKAVTALRQIGISDEWLYAFDRGVFDLSDALSISNEEINAAITAQEDINEAMLALENSLQKLTVSVAPYVSEYAPKLATAIEKYAPQIAAGMSDNLPVIANSIGNLIKSLGLVVKWFDFWARVWGNLLGKLGFKIEDIKHPISANLKTEEQIKREKEKANPQLMEQNFVREFNAFAKNNQKFIPPALQNLSPNLAQTNNTISITNHITGQNASEIARKVSLSDKEIIGNMLNKYQFANMPGK